MQRLTCRMEDGSYSLSGEMQAAIERLGTFETLYETLAAEQEVIGAELAALAGGAPDAVRGWAVPDGTGRLQSRGKEETR